MLHLSGQTLKLTLRNVSLEFATPDDLIIILGSRQKVKKAITKQI